MSIYKKLVRNHAADGREFHTNTFSLHFRGFKTLTVSLYGISKNPDKLEVTCEYAANLKSADYILDDSRFEAFLTASLDYLIKNRHIKPHTHLEENVQIRFDGFHQLYQGASVDCMISFEERQKSGLFKVSSRWHNVLVHFVRDGNGFPDYQNVRFAYHLSE